MSATAAASPASGSTQLVKLANREYTAASVQADQKDATRLGLVREKDGNYGTTPPPPATSANAKSATSVQSSLLTLQLGGE